MDGSGGRKAEQGEPIVDGLSGQALISGGASARPPAAGAQIEIGLEEIKEALGDAFMDIEIRTQSGVKPLNGTGGAIALVQTRLKSL